MAAFGSKTKQELIKTYQLNEKDTGSAEVQLCMLTERINHLVDHLKKNKKIPLPAKTRHSPNEFCLSSTKK